MKILVTDTETTGVTNEDEIIQLAYIEIEDNRNKLYNHKAEKGIKSTHEFVKNIFVQEYYPNVPIHQKAQEVHGFSKLKLIGNPNSNTVSLPKDITLIIGHNITFDIRMLKRTDESVSTIPYICTMNLIKRIEKLQGGKIGLQNYQLKTIFDYYYPDLSKHYQTRQHNALYDCEMTLLVLIAIWKHFPFIHTLIGLEKYFFSEYTK